MLTTLNYISHSNVNNHLKQFRKKVNSCLSDIRRWMITNKLKINDSKTEFIVITAICRSIYFHIRNIGKIRNLFSYNACSTIIHALISCRLDYCNSLLYNVPTHKTDRLQRLQNQCAHILTKSPRREHITPVLKSLHWLKIQDRITYSIFSHINRTTTLHQLIYVN